MKIWIKLLVGSVLGVVFGFLAPENQRFMEVLAWLEQFALRVGRYAVVPVLFFSLSIGVYELRKDGKFWPMVLKNLGVIALVAVFVVLVGVLATLALSPGRIPIMAEEQVGQIRLDVAGGIIELFPFNMFAALAGDGVFLLPFYVFAFFLGMGLSYDKIYSKPVIALIDSLSRIFFHIASFFIEILGFMIIVLSAYWAVRFRDALQMEVFGELIVMLGVMAAVLGFVVLPLFLYLLKPKANPWAVLYGSLGPAITAFFSGDVNFSLPVLLRHAKESFGIRRRSNALTLAMFGTFCRAGSAMVAAVAFIVVFNSYSSIGITTAEVLAICGHAILISFFLARHPGTGAYAALAVLCYGFGRGFEGGYLILRPIAFYLIAIGTFLDVMITSVANYAMAKLNGFAEEKSARQFI
ncbi:MAG: cation:dicarboxylase symporter family transporter [Treponema sp.]|nr:cation:dicarboxylase symporter family transporter [Treponema sp.]